MRIVLAGSSGFIGSALIRRLLQKGNSLVLLTRDPSRVSLNNPQLDILSWDGRTLGDWSDRISGTDAVINLSGAPIIGRRWNPAYKKELHDSRLITAQILVEAMKKAPLKPTVFLNASAVGYYGDVPENRVTENYCAGTGFLAELCRDWEAEAGKAAALGIRTVLLRTGIVLERSGGALQQMLPPFRFFAGGHPGSGKQGFPWIHRDDVVEAILHCLETSSLSGPVNLTAPAPATAADFCRTLGKVINRPSWAPVPPVVLHLLFGESAAMLLQGQKAVPEKLTASGYKFRYPALEPALRAALSAGSSS